MGASKPTVGWKNYHETRPSPLATDHQPSADPDSQQLWWGLYPIQHTRYCHPAPLHQESTNSCTRYSSSPSSVRIGASLLSFHEGKSVIIGEELIYFWWVVRREGVWRVREVKGIRWHSRKAFSDFVWSIPMREKLSNMQFPSFLVFSMVMECG